LKPRLGKNAIDRELKKLRDTVGAHAALTFVADESKTIGAFGRNDRFSYIQRFGGPGEVANRVLLVAGTARSVSALPTVLARNDRPWSYRIFLRVSLRSPRAIASAIPAKACCACCEPRKSLDRGGARGLFSGTGLAGFRLK
jgi:hypothetical protein